MQRKRALVIRKKIFFSSEFLFDKIFWFCVRFILKNISWRFIWSWIFGRFPCCPNLFKLKHDHSTNLTKIFLIFPVCFFFVKKKNFLMMNETFSKNTLFLGMPRKFRFSHYSNRQSRNASRQVFRTFLLREYAPMSIGQTNR